MSLMREKRISLGGAELAIALEAGRFERIRMAPLYRYAMRPALKLLKRLGTRRNGHPAAADIAAPGMPVPVGAPVAPEARALLDRVAEIEWYHTIDLPHGVSTPGFVDHRAQVALYGLPDDMRGLRALDVATNDGFWAFEMERRGAEVTAIDIGTWADFDIPRCIMQELEKTGAANKQTGQGFRLAHDLLGSRVERRILSVYELSVEKLGLFDIVFLSDLLLHLRDPQGALENVCSVVRPGGSAIIADVYSPDLEQFPGSTLIEFVGFDTHVWWRPSTKALKSMMKLAGFDRTEELSRFQLAATSDHPIHKVVIKGIISAVSESNERVTLSSEQA